MYVIIKEIINSNWVKVNVILVNSQSEIWEFETYAEAEKIRSSFQNNSDSGYKYSIKKIGNEI
jgi:hypothetical protein